MRDYAEILTRARELADAERERRFVQAQLRLPHRCVHNHRQALDTRRTVEGDSNPTYNRIQVGGSQTIGLCMLGAENVEEWPGNICEDPIDAQRCPYFVAAQSIDEVMAEYQREIADPEWVSNNMPELSALLWVIEDASTPRLTWFRRLLLKVRRFKLEPLKPAIDPSKLLPP